MRIDPETLILRVLLDGEAYATEIIERIEDMSNGGLSICMGTIQPTLIRMRDKGLVERAEQDPSDDEPTSGRRRMYYWLTKSQGIPQARMHARIITRFFIEGCAETVSLGPQSTIATKASTQRNIKQWELP